MSLQLTVRELHKVYDLFNKHLFNNSLPEVVITIQTAKQNIGGWCSTTEIWFSKKDRQEKKKYEINIVPEFFNECHISIFQVLLHEMVHLYNKVNSINDCRGSYHNKKFKITAEAHGMYYKSEKPDKKHGWAFATISSETVELIASFDIDPTVFNWYRDVSTLECKEKKKKKPTSYKLECPECGIKLRATKSGIIVICKTCNKELIQG